MSLDCYRHLAQVLPTGSAVLATVTAVQGSVPREVGAKMVIVAEGQIFGTIGGGAGEAKVIEQAIRVCQTGQKQLVEVDLTGSTKADRPTDGICGGRMQVWLERWMGERSIELIHEIVHRLQGGQPVTLVTPFASDRLPYLTDEPESASLQFGTGQAFIETLQPLPILLIVGAGHVGIQLAIIATQIGFQVAIQDDRPEWANPARYPQAIRIFTEPIAAAIAPFAQHTQRYAALVTRGYTYDLEALTTLLQSDRPWDYIGMIGSERRVRQVFQAIEARGVSRETLQSLHAPIGLDIGALTPEEIAVSIGAELILVRRGGTGRPLSSLMDYPRFGSRHCHTPESPLPVNPSPPQMPGNQ